VGSDVELKLVDWEDYKTTDKPFPRGEVWVRGPSITPGTHDSIYDKFVTPI
jgi:long-subunit acyl-CoA synthetase (AMP-forming)